MVETHEATEPHQDTDRGATLPRRQLGRRLADLRNAAGLTTEAAATAMEWSRTKIWRAESGIAALRVFDVKNMCEIYGADPTDRDVLVGLAAESKKDGWWHSYGENLPDWFEFYVYLENQASTIFQYESELVPGLLQTHDYAATLLRDEFTDADEAEIEIRANLRLEREKLLQRKYAVDLDVVLNEAVLRRAVGGPAVMSAQLGHLVYVAGRSNIRVRVLPFGAGSHRSMINNFAYLRFRQPNEPDVIYIETRTGALYLDKPKEHASYRVVMEDLSARALSVDASCDMIAAIAREFAHD